MECPKNEKTEGKKKKEKKYIVPALNLTMWSSLHRFGILSVSETRKQQNLGRHTNGHLYKVQVPQKNSNKDTHTQTHRMALNDCNDV